MKQKKGIIAKISHPRLPSVFNRTRLFHLIDKYREYPVSWISGGPGAGKTTLAASYIQSRKVPCIWYQMDRTDYDPANFFHYMTLAASEAFNVNARPLLKLSPENFLNLSIFAVQYFRELFDQLNKPFIIILDNYHEIPTDSVIHELINSGLEQVPFDLNIMILSRTPPPPVMMRLLANKIMMTIQPEELSLTKEEAIGIAALADKWKPCLESVANIAEFTGGWAAGLVLMLEYSDPEGEMRFSPKEIAKELFFNYFAGEIFNKMEPKIQDFLLKIACMPSFTPWAAETITGFTKAGKVLSDMNRKNYFTAKKSHNGTSYQFHPLFREFLAVKAEESFKPQLLTEVYRNAADILTEMGQIEDAFLLYTKSKDRTAQVNLIRNHGVSFITQGRMGLVEHWLRDLPQEIFSTDPWLLYIHGQCRLPFDPIESRNAFIQAYQYFKNEYNYSAQILTICSIIETIITEWGDFKQLDPWIDELDNLLKHKKSFLSEEIEAQALFAQFSALMFRQPQHQEMKILAERMFDLLRSDRDPQLRVMAGTYLAHYNCWIGDIFQGGIIIDIMSELMKKVTMSPLVFLTAKMSEAVIGWFTADVKGCLEAVDKGLEEAEKSGVHIIDNWLLAQEVYARLTLDDPESAKPILDRMKPILNSNRYLDIGHYHYLLSAFYLQKGAHDLALEHNKEALRFSVETGTPFPEGLNCITAAQIYFEKGDEKTAAEFNSRVRDISRSMQSHLLHMLFLFNMAYFNLKSGKHEQARESLKAALKIRKDRGLINFSCWRPEFMQDLYEEALRSGIEVEYVRSLVRKRNLCPRRSSVDIENWPWQMKIYTLGRFEVILDENPLLFHGKPQMKPMEMLKALIALGGEKVGLRRLEDLLWPDADGDKAHQASITTLHRLRKLIGNEKAVKLSESRISLNDQYCWLDVWAVDNLCSRIDDISATIGFDANAIACMADRLLLLYRGDFLKNEDDFSWARPLRIKLRSKFLRALSLCAQGLEKRGEHEKTIDLYFRGLDVDETAEKFYQGLMICYQRLGRTTECLSIYESCRETLLSVLGIAPSPETESIRNTLRQ